MGPFLLLRRNRSDSDAEDWWANDERAPEAAALIRRILRPSPCDRATLAEAVERARQVHHPHLVHAREVVLANEPVVVLEPLPSLPLSAVLADPEVPVPPALAVWIAREVVRGLAEIAADVPSGFAERAAIGPSTIHLGADGAVRLDGFDLLIRPAIASMPPSGAPLLAVAELLAELLAPAPLFAAIPPLATEDASPAALRAMEDALSRIFYAELGGDEEESGRKAIAERVGAALAETPAAAEAPAAPRAPGQGRFTRALEARARPVVPQPLSSDDVDISRAGELPAPVVLGPSMVPPPIPEKARASPAIPAGSVAESSLSVSLRGAPALTAALWFTMGFVAALAIVATLQVLAHDDEGPAPSPDKMVDSVDRR